MNRGVKGEHAYRDVKGAVALIPVPHPDVIIIVVQIILIVVVTIVVGIVVVVINIATRGNWPLLDGATGPSPARVTRIAALTNSISAQRNKRTKNNNELAETHGSTHHCQICIFFYAMGKMDSKTMETSG